jgi:hypothetical protein
MAKNWCEILVTVCKRGSLYHISELLIGLLKVSDLIMTHVAYVFGLDI